MEHSYLHEVLPFLKHVEKERRQQFEEYFRSAPLWLLDSMTVETITAGSVFICENEPAETIFFVGSGKVKATDYRISGVMFDFMKLENMIALGGMEVLMELDTYKTTLQAETDCILVKVARSKYEKWLKSDMEAFRLETKITCTSLLEEERRNRLYLFLQGAERLALLYVELYEKQNKNGILCLKENRTNRADETGLCLKSISRAIRKFVEKGLVTKNGNQIQINSGQYEKLKQFINEKMEGV